MFTHVSHFLKAWEYEREGTLKLLRALTDASLGQAVAAEDRTLGRIAWHLTTAIAEMMNRTGLEVVGPGHGAPVPATAAAIVAAYDQASGSLHEQVKSRWND